MILLLLLLPPLLLPPQLPLPLLLPPPSCSELVLSEVEVVYLHSTGFWGKSQL